MPLFSLKTKVALGLLFVVCCGPSDVSAQPRREGQDACLSDGVCNGLYEEARRLSKSGDLTAALAAYQAAHRRQPVPWLLINIGRTLHKLGRPQEALLFYKRYREAEPEGPADRQQMIKEYTEQAEKAQVEKAEAERVADERAQAQAAILNREPPPAGYSESGEPLAPIVIEKFIVAPPSALEKKKPLPRYFYAGLGIGGGLLLASAITGGVALAQSRELQSSMYAGATKDSVPTALTDEQVRVRGLALTTDVLLAVGAVTLTAVTVAMLVQRFRPGKSAVALRMLAGPVGLAGEF